MYDRLTKIFKLVLKKIWQQRMKQIVVWLTKILSRVEAMCAEKADKIIITKLYKCYLLGSGVH